MKSLYLVAFSFLVSFFFSTACAQTVTISGIVQLEGQSDHSGVLVSFYRTAPSPLFHSTYSNPDGSFAIHNVESGLYNFTYTKAGYFSATLSQVNCFSDVTLPTQTLHLRSKRINVPTDFTLIQDAIDDSFTGDTIVLARGVYKENIDMKGKAITLTSSFIFTKDNADISNTIIDGNKAKSVIICSSYETNNTVISGLTIRNGNALGDYPDNFGGGIRCIQSAPTLQYLIIENNYADYGGGGIYLLETNAMLISNVKVINNSCRVDGGGIRVSSSYPTIQNSIISKNSSFYGGGIAVNYFNSPGSTTITNCTIAYNTITSTSDNDFNGGAGIKCSGSKVSIQNSIIAFNHGDYGVSYYSQGVTDTYPFISYCLFWQNSAGDMHGCNPLNRPYITKNVNQDSVDAYFDVFADPQFIDASHNLYNVSAGSSAADAGYNNFVTTSYDVNYNDRIQNNRNLSQAYVNIGASETTGGVKPVLASFKNPICAHEELTINIQSTGTNFKWYSSATAINPLFTSGAFFSTDTLTHPTTLYVANTDSPLASARTAVTINVITKLELYAVVSANTWCTGSNGSMTAQITPGIVSDYKFNWYDGAMNPINGQTGAILSSLAAGNYSVKATHQLAGCVSDTVTAAVLNEIVNPVINDVTVSTSASCGQSNGKLQVTAISPGSPTDYTYTWYHGSTVDINQVIANENSASLSALSLGDYSVVADSKSTGCTSAAATQSVSCITAVEPNEDSAIRIYPNPASSDVHVVFNNSTHQRSVISIIDMTGRALYAFETSEAELIVSRGNITSGLYLLSISNNDQTNFYKLFYK